MTLACDFPIGGTATAYLFDIHGKAATLVGKVAEANWGGDWGAGPDSIYAAFSNGALTVAACADTDCERTTFTGYTLRGGKFAHVTIQTVPTSQAG